LKTLNAVIYQPILHASASQGSKVMAKSFVQTSTSVLDQDRVESTPIVTTHQAISLASVTKASKEIHTTDVLTLMNVHIPKLVDRVQHVRILRVVIAATALKDSTEMPDRLAVLITTNVQDRLVEEMLTVQMKLELSGATALKVL
jgi:hypothetical protein